ncbi:MAG: Alpha/beta hydrolase family protein [Parcubacteria group bacterium GW2011_GWC2_39_11]|nr:MAG: Alpha/beta hydrolase family protein [Parcubacteria group bacterium GW2011_GWC2_39_11]
MKEENIVVKDLNINYLKTGEGKPFLILHGWGSRKEKWQYVADILAEKGINVIIPDLPGFGKSEQPKIAWSLDNYCDFIVDFVNKIGVDKFYILGHSFGGAIAAKCDLRFPERIEKLFLVGAACYRRRLFKTRIFYIVSKALKIFSFIPGYFYLKKIFYRFIVKSDYISTKGIMREIYLQLVNKDYPSESILSQIKDPTIIIWGEKDRITPMKDALLINKKIKGSILEILKKSGHSSYSDYPEELAKIIIKHID